MDAEVHMLRYLLVAEQGRLENALTVALRADARGVDPRHLDRLVVIAAGFEDRVAAIRTQLEARVFHVETRRERDGSR